MELDEIVYLKRRMREERERAAAARDPAIYRAHIELARGYERRLMHRRPTERDNAS